VEMLSAAKEQFREETSAYNKAMRDRFMWSKVMPSAGGGKKELALSNVD